MLRLYSGSGSAEIELLGYHLSDAQWTKIKGNVIRLLKARKRPGPGLMDKLPWELRDGTNFFGDEFCVLYACLPIDRYVEAAEYEHTPAAIEAAKAIVDAFEELGLFVRFVAFEPDIEAAPIAVAAPVLHTDAAAVSRALEDAERLLQSNGAVSAVDRVHTALHGYLREICSQAGIQADDAGTTTALWKRMKASHPALAVSSPHTEHIQRIMSGIATVLDALNPVRNNASVAHPNAVLLTEAEAMLAVNAGRTILHYLEASLKH
jgi:hypothetical protein